MNKPISITMLVAAIAVSGCSGRSTPPEPEPPQPTFQVRYIKPAIQQWVPEQQSNAALSPAYNQHQMGMRESQGDRTARIESLLGASSIEPLTLDHYALQSLDEYCSGGRALSHHEFQRISVSDLGTISDLYNFTDCEPPQYTYVEYVEAFSNYCQTPHAMTAHNHHVIAYFGGYSNYPKSAFPECRHGELAQR